MADTEYTLNIAETADVHPTAQLLGNITIGEWTRVGPGTIIQGDVTIGHHTLIRSMVLIRVGRLEIGNYVGIYDLAQIGGGGKPWNGAPEGGHQSVIKDGAWINHGCVVHSSYIDENAAVGLNAVLDYGCKLGKGSILTNGSALPVGTHIPANCIVEGVPGQIIQANITNEDRRRTLGLVPSEAVLVDGECLERSIREKMGL